MEPRDEAYILDEGLDEVGDLGMVELPEQARLPLDQRAPLAPKVSA